MTLPHQHDPDRSDPATRAATRLARVRAGERRQRMLGALALVAIGVLGVLAAEPITGESGSTVGAIVGALLLAALAVAVWPSPWSEAESTHRALESIWHELRSDAARGVAWERYAAWAEARADTVQLMLIRCAPAGAQLAGAPSPYSRELRQRIDAEDITHAVAAMDALRAEAAELELRAEQHEHQSRLDAIDRAADAAIASRRSTTRSRELAQQEAAERRAQADAVARALRRS